MVVAVQALQHGPRYFALYATSGPVLRLGGSADLKHGVKVRDLAKHAAVNQQAVDYADVRVES